MKKKIFKKGEFTLSGFLIALLLFSLIIFVIGDAYIKTLTTYEVPIDESFITTYNVVDNTSRTIDQIGYQVNNQSSINTNAFIIGGTTVWNGMTLVFQSISIPKAIISDIKRSNVVADLGIPSIFFDVGVAILVVAIIFLILSATMRYRL